MSVISNIERNEQAWLHCVCRGTGDVVWDVPLWQWANCCICGVHMHTADAGDSTQRYQPFSLVFTSV